MRNAPSLNMHLSELNEIRAQREFHSMQLTVHLPYQYCIEHIALTV